MSDVKRYRLDPESFAQEHPQGDLVDYQDYARLKAEVERLTQNTDKLCRHGDLEIARLNAQVEAYRSASDEVAAAFLALPTPHNQVARVCEGIESLKAEVERLRKAGDALQKRLYVLENPTHPEVYLKLLSAWNAAKEGKQP